MAVKYWVGGTGNWSTAGRWSTSTGQASFTASRPTGTNATLTVSSVQSGTIASGQLLYDSGGTARGTIGSQLSGTTGGAGTYATVASSSTLTSQACYTMASGSATTVPTSGSTDEIVFDYNSGPSPTVTVTVTGYAGSVYIGNVGSLYISGYSATSNINGTLTIAGTSTLNIYDNLKIASSGSTVNWSHSGTLNFTTRGGNLSAPNTNISSSIVVPSGTWTLVDNMSDGGTLSFTGGTINLGTYTWTRTTATITGSTAKVLNFGTSGALSLSYSYFYSQTTILNITSTFTQLSFQGTEPLFITTGADQKTIDFTSATWTTNSSSTYPFPSLKSSGGYIVYSNSGYTTLNANVYFRSIDLTGSTSSAYIFGSASLGTAYISGNLIVPSSVFSFSMGYQYSNTVSVVFTGSNKSLQFYPQISYYSDDGMFLSATFVSGSSYTQTGGIKFRYLNAQAGSLLTLNDTGPLASGTADNYSISFNSNCTLVGNVDASQISVVDNGFVATNLTSLKCFSYYNSGYSRSFALTLIKRKETLTGTNFSTGLFLYNNATLGSITFSDPNNIGSGTYIAVELNNITLPSTVNWTVTSLTLSGTITIPTGSVFNIIAEGTGSDIVKFISSAACSTPVTINVNCTGATAYSPTRLESTNSSNNLTLNITGNSSSTVRFGQAGINYFDSIDFTGFYGTYHANFNDGDTVWRPSIYVKNLFKITANTQFSYDGYINTDPWYPVNNRVAYLSTTNNIYAISTYGNTNCTINIPSNVTVGGLYYNNSNITFTNSFTLQILVLGNSINYTASQGTLPTVSNYYLNGTTSTLNLNNSSNSIDTLVIYDSSTVNLNTSTSSIQYVSLNGNSSTINFNSSANIIGSIYQNSNNATLPNTINFNSSTTTINNITLNSTIVNFNTSSPTVTGSIITQFNLNFNTSSPTINNITLKNNAIAYLDSGSALNCTGLMFFQDNAYLDATNATFSVKNLTNETSYNTSVYTGSTVNLSGVLNDNFSSFNNVVVKSSAVTIGAYYIENLSNTVAPSTVKFSTPVKLNNFNLQGTESNLVTVTSSNTTPRYLMKPSAWNVGSNSVNTSNNFGITLSAGTSDYLDFSYIVGIDTSLSNKLTATQTQQLMPGSYTGSYAYAGNVLELLIKGNAHTPSSGSSYKYNIVVPTGATVSYYATIIPSTQQYNDGGYEGTAYGDPAYLFIDNANKLNEVSGTTLNSTTGTLSVGTHTLEFLYAKDIYTSSFANKDLARLFVYFYAVLPSNSSKFFLMF